MFNGAAVAIAAEQQAQSLPRSYAHSRLQLDQRSCVGRHTEESGLLRGRYRDGFSHDRLRNRLSLPVLGLSERAREARDRQIQEDDERESLHYQGLAGVLKSAQRGRRPSGKR